MQIGTLIKIEATASSTGTRILTAITLAGEDVTAEVPTFVVDRAYRTGQLLKYIEINGLGSFKLTDPPELKPDNVASSQIPDFLINSINLKPESLIISDLKWRFAVRSVLRGDNLFIRGAHGTGKTTLVRSLATALNRPFEKFNLGSTQDPRSSLIGNTHFKRDEGTFVAEALFVKMIQVPNAVILLDEITRAHPDAVNILMSVLDKTQRYLRIDEQPDTPTIQVAEGVTFIATGNVGSQYTTTRVMDRAFADRFAVLMLDPLSKEDEQQLLSKLYPTVEKEMIRAIAEIADDTRKQAKSENSRISDIISTRQTVEMASLALDGFTLPEIAEVCIYPFYSDAGGPQSEQTYMRGLIQKYVKVGKTSQKSSVMGNTNPNLGRQTPWMGVGS